MYQPVFPPSDGTPLWNAKFHLNEYSGGQNSSQLAIALHFIIKHLEQLPVWISEELSMSTQIPVKD